MHKGFTVMSFLERASRLFPNRKIIFRGVSRTYAETYDRVIRATNACNSIGITKGSVIGVADWNTPAFAEMLYVAGNLGAVVYPINIRLPPGQILQTLKQTGVQWFCVSKEFEQLPEGAGADKNMIVSMDGIAPGRSYEKLVNDGTTDPPAVDISGTDPYSILCTSGTTGAPKSVIYTHEKTVHGAISIVHQLGHFNTPASLSSRDTIMPLIPFYHLWAWGTLFHASYLGSNYVLGGRFEPKAALKSIKDEGITWINAIPTMIHELLNKESDGELRGLKILVGGSTVPLSLASKMSSRGIHFSTIYGGTDMLAVAISILPEDLGGDESIDMLRRTTHPVPFAEVKITSPAGTDVPAGEIGELYVRTPWLPGGYYNDQERTRLAYSGGWFRTGDVARLTEKGGLQVVDRVSDVIKSGGEWIPSSILESAICEVHGVETAAIIAVPDDKWGERPLAVIKTTAGSDFTREQLMDHLMNLVKEGKISKWWIPESIELVEQMPLTSVGKIDKSALRQRFHSR